MPRFTVEHKASLYVEVTAIDEEDAKAKSREVAVAASRSFDSITVQEQDWIVIDPNTVVGVTWDGEDEEDDVLLPG